MPRSTPSGLVPPPARPHSPALPRSLRRSCCPPPPGMAVEPHLKSAQGGFRGPSLPATPSPCLSLLQNHLCSQVGTHCPWAPVLRPVSLEQSPRTDPRACQFLGFTSRGPSGPAFAAPAFQVECARLAFGDHGWGQGSPGPNLVPCLCCLSPQASSHCWSLARWACRLSPVPSCLPPSSRQWSRITAFTPAAPYPPPQHLWPSHPRPPRPGLHQLPAPPHLLPPSCPRAHQRHCCHPRPLRALSLVPQVGVRPGEGGLTGWTQGMGSCQAWLSKYSLHPQAP